MATKFFQLLLCIFLITSVFPLPSHENPSENNVASPTSFDFIKDLEGSQKGQVVKGLSCVNIYLGDFGYLNYSPNGTHANKDYFDDALEAAVKMYQLNFHLKTTGTLDAQTVSQMMAPRCGNSDTVNGTNWMRANYNKEANQTLHTVSHWSSSGKKWPPSKYDLKYAFLPETSLDAKSAVSRAFNTWSNISRLTFTETQSFDNADLKIGFYRRDHGDGAKFYGMKGALAHAFNPPLGLFHYNADRRFSVNPIPGVHHLETVALHEIGHLLGLSHSNIPEAIMYPIIPDGTIKGLHDDDIKGIQALYG